VSVFDLQQVRLPLLGDPADQRPQAARLMLADLPREGFVGRWQLVQIHRVDLIEDFVQLAVVDHIMLFANRDEREIHASRQFAAKIVHANCAAVREWVRQKGRDHQHADTLIAA
jgi:hypothetical protein